MAFRMVAQRAMQKTSYRLAAPAIRALSSESAVAPASSSAMPSAHDVIVQLTFIDPSGARRKVPGYIGKTLHEVCEMHGIDIGPASVGGAVEKVQSDTWTEPLYGEGACSGFDHVLLTGNGVETAAPKTHVEQRMLNDYWDEDELYPESRLACMITLTKEMDGMSVFVPPRIVDDIP
mmetsp:Transcript_7351/g.10503  ORF Transcript_7351/g.10503 Transcript_7351/m.10503 type:complete len:177 (-) Transcript_7351:128-658(-)